MISGDIVDQAALHGTLNRIRDLNLALISVTRNDPEPVDPKQSDQPVATDSHSPATGKESHVSPKHRRSRE